MLSRDQTVPHNHKLALFIYNLEPSYMGGSHWIATYVRDNVINYFDSFGLQPFQELVRSCKKKKLNSITSKPTIYKTRVYLTYYKFLVVILMWILLEKKN